MARKSSRRRQANSPTTTIVIGLCVNNEETLAVARDEPIVFTISVAVESPAVTAKPIVIGTTKRPWWQGVVLQLVVDGRARALPWALEVLENPTPPSIIRLDAVTSWWIDLAVERQSMEGLEAGDHTIRAQLRLPGRTRLTAVDSEPVRVTVQSVPSNMNSPDSLEKKGRVEWRRGHQAEAEQLARQGLELDPGHVRLLILLGDIQNARNDPQAALSTYRAALQSFDRRYPDSYQRPRSLEGKIARLEVQLSQL